MVNGVYPQSRIDRSSKGRRTAPDSPNCAKWFDEIINRELLAQEAVKMGLTRT